MIAIPGNVQVVPDRDPDVWHRLPPLEHRSGTVSEKGARPNPCCPDNELCSSVQQLRSGLPPLLAPLTQLHGWWHLFAGTPHLEETILGCRYILRRAFCFQEANVAFFSQLLVTIAIAASIKIFIKLE